MFKKSNSNIVDFDENNFVHELNIVDNYRYERKFTIPDYYSIQEIEHHIKSNFWLFSEIFHKRQVNNIYFDTLDYNDYLDNVSGVADRKKIRIRWYEETFGMIENPILEVKVKQGLVGNKLSYPIESFTLDNTFTKEYIHTVFDNSEIPKAVFEDLKIAVPTLLNSYQRKYYISSDKRFRITLDFDLKYYNMDVRFNNFKKIPQKNPDKIIELKYSPLDDVDAKIITTQFPFRLNKNSKYVNGIDFLKHLPK